nr:hypothetical protein [Tanacetum cinerariifolium]
MALDEALVPSTQRLRIGRSNFRLPSDIQSKESTLQVVYDVLRRCPFFKVNWHYVKDDMIFLTIKVVSRHQNTKQYGMMLPIKLTNDEIRNTKAYKEYYDCVTREAAPKPKASARRKRSETREEESFDPIPRTPEDSEDDGNGKEDQGLRISKEQRLNEEEGVDELYRDININQGRGVPLSQDIKDSHVTLTPVNPDGMKSIFATASSPMATHQTTTPIMTPSTRATIKTISHAPIPPTKIPSEVLQNISTFDSVFRFEDRLKSLEANFSKYIQTNPFAKATSNILGIVHQYMNQQMNEARIIKEQVKGQVKEQILIILPIIEQSVNAQLEAEVLTWSSHSSRTSYAVAADLSEMELKKILIEKMDGNKEDAMMSLTRMKDPPLDQIGGIRDEEKVSASESAFAEEPVQTTDQMDEPSYSVFETGAGDQTIVQYSHHFDWFSQPKKPPTPDHDWNKTLPAKRQQFYGFAVNRESALDVYSKRRIIAVTDLKIVKWHSYKHLDWITVRHDDDKLYMFKEGDFKMLRLQDIEDMLLLLIQGKLSNLTVEERFAFNVSLRMFTRSIVIQRCAKDLQLGVKSYQKRLNLTKPDTYLSDLKRREAYTAYSNPRGFIYQNKDKKNRLMRIDKLHKFSDGTLNDVRNALNDRLKGIRM